MRKRTFIVLSLLISSMIITIQGVMSNVISLPTYFSDLFGGMPISFGKENIVLVGIIGFISLTSIFMTFIEKESVLESVEDDKKMNDIKIILCLIAFNTIGLYFSPFEISRINCINNETQNRFSVAIIETLGICSLFSFAVALIISFLPLEKVGFSYNYGTPFVLKFVMNSIFSLSIINYILCMILFVFIFLR
jgi:hypothetical protein